MQKSCTWAIGDGSKIGFWVDDWLGVGSLYQTATKPISTAGLTQKVEVFLNDFG